VTTAAPSSQFGTYSPDSDAFERVPLERPLTRQQEVVVTLVADGMNYVAIADVLRITMNGVRFHANAAARKIPGDLPPQMRIVAWARGAPLHVLTGDRFRAWMDGRAKAQGT
jgi:DNA-binding CsgD family transcriptional regulator